MANLAGTNRSVFIDAVLKWSKVGHRPKESQVQFQNKTSQALSCRACLHIWWFIAFSSWASLPDLHLGRSGRLSELELRQDAAKEAGIFVGSQETQDPALGPEAGRLLEELRALPHSLVYLRRDAA